MSGSRTGDWEEQTEGGESSAPDKFVKDAEWGVAHGGRSALAELFFSLSRWEREFIWMLILSFDFVLFKS